VSTARSRPGAGSAAPDGRPTTPSRVALVLATSTGGTGRHVTSLAVGLVGSGVEVTVYAPEATDRLFGFAERGARFVPVEIPARPHAGDLRMVRALRRDLGAAGVDLVHAHGLRAGLFATLARPDSVPLVVTWHNTVLGGGLRARGLTVLERRVARGADVTLAVSPDLVARVTALGGRDVRPAIVVAPPLAPPTRPAADVRAELGLADGQPLVLSVGRLHPQKALDVLIAAAARWRDRDPAPVVAIAGSGPSFLPLTRQISESDAPVLLLGHRTDIADLLRAADVAVMTSTWEGQPLFPQEALRAGVPLVATRVGGLPEVVGDAAVLVPVGDVDAVDAEVRALLDDPAHRAAVVARGLVRAAALPTEADELAQVRAVYAELLGRAS
jgi:glycosyltransferase involved in cell wall biosynthesis